jgi:hypothetical protein
MWWLDLCRLNILHMGDWVTWLANISMKAAGVRIVRVLFTSGGNVFKSYLSSSSSGGVGDCHWQHFVGFLRRLQFPPTLHLIEIAKALLVAHKQNFGSSTRALAHQNVKPHKQNFGCIVLPFGLNYEPW